MVQTTFTKTIPPEIELSDELPPKVVLVNLFDVARLDFNQDNKNKVFAEGSQQLYMRLEYALQNDGQFLIWFLGLALLK